jgi:plastocyanin
MTTALRIAAGLGALMLSVPGFGCGGSDAAPAAAPAAVETVDFGFDPQSLDVHRGDAVTWSNAGQTTHNVKGTGFFSGALEPGGTYRHTFAKPGTYRYLCTLHPTLMRGVVVVTP